MNVNKCQHVNKIKGKNRKIAISYRYIYISVILYNCYTICYFN